MYAEVCTPTNTQNRALHTFTLILHTEFYKVNIKPILKTMKLDKGNQSFDVWFMTPMTFLPPACLYVYNMSAESRWYQIHRKLL